MSFPGAAWVFRSNHSAGKTAICRYLPDDVRLDLIGHTHREALSGSPPRGAALKAADTLTGTTDRSARAFREAWSYPSNRSPWAPLSKYLRSARVCRVCLSHPVLVDGGAAKGQPVAWGV